MKKSIKMTGFAAALTLAVLACNLGSSGTTQATVPISTEAAESLVAAWEQAFDNARETGTLALTLTEEQLTSFLALSMAENENLPFSNPQVLLRDGEMEIVGTYNSDFVNANVSIVMEVAVDAGGLPTIEVTSGSVGPLPVPAELLTAVSDAINEAMTGQAASTATGFSLQVIQISEGVLTLTGSLD
jgi:hypothetical protein